MLEIFQIVDFASGVIVIAMGQVGVADLSVNKNVRTGPPSRTRGISEQRMAPNVGLRP